MEDSDFVSICNTQAITALGSSNSVFRIPRYVDFMDMSSGSSTIVILITCFLFSRGASHTI